MSTKEERDARAANRKRQLNVEVTRKEKDYFELIAKTQGTKLATLIRTLLHVEGRQLGLAPPEELDANGRFGLIID